MTPCCYSFQGVNILLKESQSIKFGLQKYQASKLKPKVCTCYWSNRVVLDFGNPDRNEDVIDGKHGAHEDCSTLHQAQVFHDNM